MDVCSNTKLSILAAFFYSLFLTLFNFLNSMFLVNKKSIMDKGLLFSKMILDFGSASQNSRNRSISSGFNPNVLLKYSCVQVAVANSLNSIFGAISLLFSFFLTNNFKIIPPILIKSALFVKVPS